MGASGWKYFVPYQSDIAKALHELREQVFQRGEYYKLEPFWQEMDEDEYSNEDGETREYLVGWLRGKKEMKEPTTIEGLLLWNEEEGTHSIIDITDVSPIPEFGRVAPLSSQQLMKIFGTHEPTQLMVKQKIDEIMQLRERWQATFIIVYKDGLPDQIFFTGYSGD